jgi:hypothetical protein
MALYLLQGHTHTNSNSKNKFKNLYYHTQKRICHFTSVEEQDIVPKELGMSGPKDQKSYVLLDMWTLDQGQTQQGDWTLSS